MARCAPHPNLIGAEGLLAAVGATVDDDSLDKSGSRFLDRQPRVVLGLEIVAERPRVDPRRSVPAAAVPSAINARASREVGAGKLAAREGGGHRGANGGERPPWRPSRRWGRRLRRRPSGRWPSHKLRPYGRHQLRRRGV
eukprot:62283-Prymnesium_polylepis.1